MLLFRCFLMAIETEIATQTWLSYEGCNYEAAQQAQHELNIHLVERPAIKFVLRSTQYHLLRTQC
jgi:hypothetical protein